MRLAIVTPVFNDWQSFNSLIPTLEEVAREDLQLSIFAINDGSSDPTEIVLPSKPLTHIRSIEVIDLVCNVGHQRAIAVGLAEVCRRGDFDSVLVMDSDGEDRPSDIPQLIRASREQQSHIICAARGRRPGLLIFRVWYECYKLIFRLLTGAQIDFGNFCLIPQSRLEAIATNSATWNNLAATIARSRIPLSKLPLDRGKRYAGRSKMNFVALVMHGRSAMAVYTDVVMVRLMIASAMLSALAGIGICIVVFVRLFTNFAIPGWASLLVGVFSVIGLQALMFFTIAAFSVLNSRSAKVVIPRNDALDFILTRRKLQRIGSAAAE